MENHEYRPKNTFLTQEEDWGNLCWLANRKMENSEKMTLGRVTIKPGCNNPRHTHFLCDEILYLMQGTLDHTLENQTIRLHAGDVLTIPAGMIHNAKNVGEETADMIVAYPSGTRDFQLEGERNEEHSQSCSGGTGSRRSTCVRL